MSPSARTIIQTRIGQIAPENGNINLENENIRLREMAAAVTERLNDTESLLAAAEAEAIYYQMQHQQEQHKFQALLKQRDETESATIATGMSYVSKILFRCVCCTCANHLNPIIPTLQQH